MISVTASPCKQSWYVCLNGECFHTEPTKHEAMKVAEFLSKNYQLELV